MIKGTGYKGITRPKTPNRGQGGNPETGNSRDRSKLCGRVGWGNGRGGELGPQKREILWPLFHLPSMASQWPDPAGNSYTGSPLTYRGLQSRQRVWDGSELQQAKPSRVHFWRCSQVSGAVWLTDGQCPLLTFLMSSERKHRTYFTDRGCFTHRGCFTVCDKGHSVGCGKDPVLRLPRASREYRAPPIIRSLRKDVYRHKGSGFR